MNMLISGGVVAIVICSQNKIVPNSSVINHNSMELLP